MEKSNLTIAYQIARVRRPMAEGGRGHVTRWLAEISVEDTTAALWIGPFRQRRRPWPGSQPRAGVYHPLI